MDSFEVAKIGGAVLSALLVIVGFRVMLEIAEEGRKPEPPGYTLPMPQAAAPATAPAAGPAAAPAAGAAPAAASAPTAPQFSPADVAQAATTANAQAGAATFKKCQACHSGEKDGPNKVGPNLWGVVGRPKASHEGFNYSDAMKKKGGDWSLVDIATFVHSPKEFVPGTKMLFPGIADPNDLADVLAYLNTLK
jgi:cytochrome c